MVSGVETPLLTSRVMGFGHEGGGGPAGLLYRRAAASELPGPLLVKNPRLLEWTVSGLLERRGLALPETPPADRWAEEGWRVTEAELRKRWSR